MISLWMWEEAFVVVRSHKVTELHLNFCHFVVVVIALVFCFVSKDRNFKTQSST
jgi:hypothetical protein